MVAALYAEVYLICMIVVSLLIWWCVRSKYNAVSERWLRLVLISFLLNFTANFCFTLFNGGLIGEGSQRIASYLFKTLYFITLGLGVSAWCGYAMTERHAPLLQDKKRRWLLLIPTAIPVVLALGNLFTRHLFYMDAEGRYTRDWMFQWYMGFLLLYTLWAAIPLLREARWETDPAHQSHMHLTASFPLCILAAWVLSFIGESVPVICVSVMVELLCLYTGTVNQMVSLDKLTQVNNRQNLTGFMSYKLKNHQGTLYLMMVDIDYFKEINDTWGHLEGDNALVDVAGSLKSACAPVKKRPYIARYGGDEFVVVMEGTKDELEALRQRILDECARRSASRPYKLQLSIGIAETQPDMSPKDFIALADAELYRIKKNRR